MMTAKSSQSLPSQDDINHQLEFMIASPDFTATPQQTALLRYIVGQTMAGKAERIKGYTVATEVFGRKEDFDQNIDPIVSIQAGRLRRALARYYDGAGKNDPLRIDVPKGSYIPVFTDQCPLRSPAAIEKPPAVSVRERWPTVQVQPLVNLTADSENDYLAAGFTAELTHALGRYTELRVIESRPGNPVPVPLRREGDFIIDGNLRCDADTMVISVRLHDARKGLQIWSGSYRGKYEEAARLSFQEEKAAEIAFRLSGGYAEIARYLAALSAYKPTNELSTYEAMLRFWACDAQRTRTSYVRAIEALERAVAREPGCGQLWTMLARLYADNHGLEIVDLPTPLEKAVVFAQKGVSLEPTSRRAHSTLAYVRLLEGRLLEARCEVDAAYDQNQCSSIYLDVLGWLMCLTGQWERGVDCIRKAISSSPYYRPWIRHGLFFNFFRLGDYEKAYRESIDFMMPELFWEPMLKASVCGHLGRIEEGRKHITNLMTAKPDFQERGRLLISRYIKIEALADQIIEGLEAFGVKVK
ncbi:MAG: hypothetical protein QNJ48_07885 [Desulfobacterales bacterium]|nr:hypothetical protein [Desulfobacterales bacterium]MDJ0884066.1 hypothetical protein [Desulfobacterales bacterium]